jgi:hypothetical protein
VHLLIFIQFDVKFDVDCPVCVVDMQRRLRQVTERKREAEPRKPAAEARIQANGEKTKQKANLICVSIMNQ